MDRRGWIEGRNLVVERRFADGNCDRMPALAQELVEARLDVVMTLAQVDAAHLRQLDATLSYGPDISAIGRQLARQIDRILRGA